MNSHKNKLADFFSSAPSYNNDKDYAAYASLTMPLNMFFLVCVVMHTGYLIVFSIYRADVMMIFDLLCVILYATFVILLKHFKGSWLPCTLLTILQLYLHQICCVAFFGLKPGFHYLMITLMFLAVFISKKGKAITFLRNGLIIVVSITFICLLVFFDDYIPPITLSDEINIGLLIINCAMSFAVSAIYVGKVVHSIDDKRSMLDTSVDEKVEAIERMQHQIIISFANIIEARDGSTGKHVKRTTEYVQALVTELYNNGDYRETLTPQYIHDTILSAPLHDIGKITVPDAILLKPGKLDKEEFKAIQNHTVNGKKIIEESMADIEDEEFLKIAKSVALYHHECWDGSGYPFGIEGQQIPLCARIMTIADFFDALAAKRIYKEAMPTSKVFEMIKEQRGKKFDPIVTDAFLRIQDQIDHIARSNAD